ncbi:toprim domain-containing protein [Sphingobacterium spiritivorum]|uniref:toprim domain-containing protein n=1 Tax=Sphingobacterium spiritivorum TaxID=258 RepID=UPI003DA68837
MEFSRQRLSIEEAKKIDIVSYLADIGYSPTKIHNNDYWYLSPLRDEKTPSFKVNRSLNKWYDHGIGEGGSLIDFGIRFYRCSVSELLIMLAEKSWPFEPQTVGSVILQRGLAKIEITGNFSIQSPSLLTYLKERKIPVDIAKKYCQEVRYRVGNKTYFGIGFRNDSGGYEIRNPYFKCSSSPKDITTMNNNADQVVVFEGFFDFLSFITLHPQLAETAYDYVILNSLALFKKARQFMEAHSEISLYLDNDPAGRKCTETAMSTHKAYTDESRLYKQHKDLNDWMVNFGKTDNNT